MVHLQNGKIVLSGNIIIKDKQILLLFRKSHQHWETPGGKVNRKESLNEEPSLEELKLVAERELMEEVLGIQIISMEYFGNVHFVIPDGREAIANKFLVEIEGNPKIGEPEIFSKLEWLSLDKIKDYKISPDLKLFLDEIFKKFF